MIAKIAKDQGIPVIGIITVPFCFEQRRIPVAKEGVKKLLPCVDHLIEIHNDSLMPEPDLKKLAIDGAFALSDQELLKSVRSVVDMITEAGGC